MRHQQLLKQHKRNPEVLTNLLANDPLDSGIFYLNDGEDSLLTALRDESITQNKTTLDLSYGYFYEANLFSVFLRGNNLFHAKLKHAELGHADLYGANLRMADLCDANLGGANLFAADLRGAINLTEKQIRSAYIDEATQLDPKFYDLKREILAARNKHQPMTTPTPAA
ncbi:MAG TPA: hypothetical protein DEA55_05100 [Rhodospirillaceae bacterium]|nr:hypothetical protein [Rhodospirillaceae bacterium]